MNDLEKKLGIKTMIRNTSQAAKNLTLGLGMIVASIYVALNLATGEINPVRQLQKAGYLPTKTDMKPMEYQDLRKYLEDNRDSLRCVSYTKNTRKTIECEIDE